MYSSGDSFINALPAGTRIGPILIGTPIGQGAWGIVYEAQHDVHGRVAVKEYFPSAYGSRSTRGSVGSSAPQWQDAIRRGRERFIEEGRALRTIRHENVVPVLDFVEDEQTTLLVMEFVEGRTLAGAVEAGEYVDSARVIALAATLVDTLAAIHAKNIIHRDIALDNIMVRGDGTPVLIDFGGAAAAVATATRSTQNIVKDGYSPPELYDTSSNPTFPVGPWSDIYAAAAVITRIVSGKELPVSNARLLAAGTKSAPDPLVSLRTLAPAGYTATWLGAVDSALQLLPKDRPQSALAWRKAFDSEVRPKPGRNWSLVGLTAGGVGMAALAAALLVVPRLTPSAASPVPSPTHAIATKSAQPRVATRPTAPPPIPREVRHAPPAIPNVAGPSTPTAMAVRTVDEMPRVQYVYVTPRPALTPVAKAPPHRSPVKAAVEPRSAPLGDVAVGGRATDKPAPILSPMYASPFPTPAPTAPPTGEPPAPTVAPTAAPAPAATAPPAYGPDTCQQGYVWRNATDSDHVCVTPADRLRAYRQNALAAARRDPAGGPSGPNTCLVGYVWREAYTGDVVCVSPNERRQAAYQNRVAASRRVQP